MMRTVVAFRPCLIAAPVSTASFAMQRSSEDAADVHLAFPGLRPPPGAADLAPATATQFPPLRADRAHVVRQRPHISSSFMDGLVAGLGQPDRDTGILNSIPLWVGGQVVQPDVNVFESYELCNPLVAIHGACACSATVV